MKPTDPFYPDQPERAYVVLDSTPGVGLVTRGYRGYSLVYDYPPSEHVSYECCIAAAQKVVDRCNAALGVTKGQALAAQIGSMFGWSVPGANPAMWHEDGTPNRAEVAAL